MTTSLRFPALLTLALLLLSSFSPSQGVEQKSFPPYEDPDAYDVYNQLIAEEFPNRPSERRKLDAYYELFGEDFSSRSSEANKVVISAETEPGAMCLKPEGESATLLAPAITDYFKQNETRRFLQPKFKVEQQYELLAPQDASAHVRGNPDRWRIELSAVGFNRDKTIAIVSATSYCGEGLCGGGAFYVFVKKCGKWQRLEWKGTSCVWAS